MVKMHLSLGYEESGIGPYCTTFYVYLLMLRPARSCAGSSNFHAGLYPRSVLRRGLGTVLVVEPREV